MILDHNGLLPSFCHITEARKYDLVVAREWDFPAGTIIVFDRGYTDFRWFRSLNDRGIFFVTRLKKKTLYEVVEERPVPQRGGVIRDAVIRLTSRQLKGGASPLLRLVEYRDDDRRVFEFLTNHLKFGSTTIAAIYKQRWQIESCF
jgi:IS4 transposase